MTTQTPPNPWFNMIDYNPQFFTTSSNGTVTLAYVNANFLRTTGSITISNCQTTNFNYQVNFNNSSSAPSCNAIAVLPNDLVTKQYVDSQAPLSSYLLYCNYSQSFITPAPTTYSLLSASQTSSPSTQTITTVGLTPLLVGAFFNSIATLGFGNSIPAGNWGLNIYANVASSLNAGALSFNYILVGVDSFGTETIIATSAQSSLVNVISPLKGTYNCVISFPLTNISAYVDIGIKIYATSNNITSISGNIFYETSSSYTSIETSFAIVQPPNLLASNNTWTGSNTFSQAIKFPDASSQSTAFLSLPVSQTYTNATIVTNANGSISSISSGSGGGTNATTITLSAGAGTTNYIPFSTTLTGSSALTTNSTLTYNVSTGALSSTSFTGNLTGYSTGIVNSGLTANTNYPLAYLSSNTSGANVTVSSDTGGNHLLFNPTTNQLSIAGNVNITGSASNLSIGSTGTAISAANAAVISFPVANLQSASSLIGTNVNSIGNNSTYQYQSGTISAFINNATSGTIQFFTNTSTPTQTNPFNISSSAITANTSVNLVGTATNLSIASTGTAISCPSATAISFPAAQVNVSALTIGSNTILPGNNGCYAFQNNIVFQYINNATAGQVQFLTYDGSNVQSTPLTIASAALTATTSVSLTGTTSNLSIASTGTAISCPSATTISFPAAIVKSLNSLIGTSVNAIANNSTYFNQSSTVCQITNNATSGTINFYTANATPTSTNPLTITSTTITANTALSCATTLVTTGLLTANGGVQLPSNGTATTLNQLGYSPLMTTSAATFVSTGTVQAIGNFGAGVLTPGTYQVNYRYSYTITWSVAGALTQLTIGLNQTSSTSIGGTYSLNNIYHFGSVTSTMPISTQFVIGVTGSGIIIVPNSSTVTYFTALAKWTGTAVCTNVTGDTGACTFTRIA